LDILFLSLKKLFCFRIQNLEAGKTPLAGRILPAYLSGLSATISVIKIFLIK